MDSFQEIGPGDSRHAMKQRDIAATIRKMGDDQKKQRQAWESQFEDTLTEVTLENVLRGGGDRSILCGGARFRANYDAWLRSL